MLIIIWPLTVYINLGGHFFASHSPVKEYKVIIDCTFNYDCMLFTKWFMAYGEIHDGKCYVASL